MRRVNPFFAGESQDNYFIHLARYMLVIRQLSGSEKVLEIGCGVGYGARLIADVAKSVDAFDIENNLAVEWKKFDKKNLNFVEKLPHEKYDVIISFEVIEHIEDHLLDEYFKNILSRLSDDGVAYISTPRAIPFEQRSKNRQIEHVYEYSPDEFRNILKKYFKNVFIFAQNDGIISTQNINLSWNMVAICTI